MNFPKMRIDRLNLRSLDEKIFELQLVVPYQGTGEPANVSRALHALKHFSSQGVIPGFPPILDSSKQKQLRASIEVCHELLSNRPNLDLRSHTLRKLLKHVPTLLAFSIPSLLPALEHVASFLDASNHQYPEILRWYGDCAHYLKNYPAAKAAYTQLLNFSSPDNNAPFIAHANRGLGDCALKSRLYDKALYHYETALRYYRNLKREDSMPRCLRSIADANRALGEHKTALRLYAKAVSLANSHKQRWNYAKTLQEIGWTHWISGNPWLARQSFTEALQEYNHLDRTRGRFSCCFALARLFAFKCLNLQTLRPTREEREVGDLLGHRPWHERGAVMALRA